MVKCDGQAASQSGSLWVIIPGKRKRLARGDHLNSWKKRSEAQNAGANENLSCSPPTIPGIAPGVAPRIVVSVLLKSWDAIPRMEFRIPRAAPRIPQNSPRAPRMAFSLRERFSWNWGGPQTSENDTNLKLFVWRTDAQGSKSLEQRKLSLSPGCPSGRGF